MSYTHRVVADCLSSSTNHVLIGLLRILNLSNTFEEFPPHGYHPPELPLLHLQINYYLITPPIWRPLVHLNVESPWLEPLIGIPSIKPPLALLYSPPSAPIITIVLVLPPCAPPPVIIGSSADRSVCHWAADLASKNPFATTPTTAKRMPMKSAFRLNVVLGRTCKEGQEISFTHSWDSLKQSNQTSKNPMAVSIVFFTGMDKKWTLNSMPSWKGQERLIIIKKRSVRNCVNFLSVWCVHINGHTLSPCVLVLGRVSMMSQMPSGHTLTALSE